ncbi:unnamed protein product [Moneuplotes crassus]|uniref:Ribosome biogenesis protein BOP1 homolog n=1 Tax=Euplotes crassus TaxID=5936 RepID=A0AAD1X0S2_EUPCR|nr:unnamed protein product [Moneuplotes crassus]
MPKNTTKKKTKKEEIQQEPEEVAPEQDGAPVEDPKSVEKTRKSRKRNREEQDKPREPLDIGYNSADSDDEEVLIRTGNIPDNWYDDYAEGDGLVGYDVKGEKVQKAPELQRDELDEFLRRQNDPNWWRELNDKLNNKNVKLSKEDVEMIERIRSGRFAFAEDDNDDLLYRPPENDDNPEFMHAMSDFNPKRRYVRSLHERKRVNRYLQAIRRGWLKVRTREEILQEYKKKNEQVWDIWKDESITAFRPRRLPKQIDAPKKDPPAHAESYNPPKEYLLDEKEKEEQDELEPEERLYNFEPQIFDSLRKVPLYNNLIKETFERCLDLYICPRVQRKKINIAASQLIPDMPNPSELKPFPSKVSIEYKGHDEAKVRSLTVSPCGKYLASGDDQGNVFLWDVKTGRIRHKYKFEGIVDCVRFNPNKSVLILSVVNHNHVYMIMPQKLYTRDERKDTENLIKEFKNNFIPSVDTSSTKKPPCKWEFLEQSDKDFVERDVRVKLEFEYIIKKIDWHSKGDYFATLADNIQTSTQVLIHSLSKAQTQKPFSKSKGIIETISFHPVRPLFFVCNDQQVFCYNLQKQVLIRKFHSGARMVSSIALHPKGDNFVIGSYDKKLMWFDLEMGNTPYKKMKYHSKAIRNVSFSGIYPLFASASDDGSLNVFHSQVYEDSAMNPLIVPVKILRGHGVRDKLGVLDCVFHPDQPWLFSAGADGRLLLWV